MIHLDNSRFHTAITNLFCKKRVHGRKWSFGDFLFSLIITLIGKSWKIHPEVFTKFQLSGAWHRPISGKSIQYFFEISITGAWAGSISGKFIHQFLWVFSFCKISGHDSWARPVFGKLVHIWMNFTEIGLCHAPEIVKFHFSTRCNFLDVFFRNPPVSCRMTHAPKF